MMRKLIVILLSGMIALSNGNAQQVFYSQSLQNLYYSLPETCRDVASRISTIDTVILCYNIALGDAVPVTCHWDENEVLEHIGYRFLPVGDTVTVNNVIVRFIERELLSLLLTSDISQAFVSYRENSISILLNDKPIRQSALHDKQGFLSLLRNFQYISINFIDDRKYEVSLVFDKGQKVSFHFPADSELLTGMNKKERDIRLAVQLKNHRAKRDGIVVPDYSYLQLFRDTIYVDKGSSFMIPQINNDIFYMKIDSTYNLVFDNNFLAESFSNKLIVPTILGFTINITHRMYGNQVKKYSVNSRDFDDYFLCDYDRYFGIETIEKDKLTGTLILSDRNAASIHLAYVSVKIDDLLNGGTMEMQLNSNIPQQNIKTLFGK